MPSTTKSIRAPLGTNVKFRLHPTQPARLAVELSGFRFITIGSTKKRLGKSDSRLTAKGNW